MEKIKEMSIDLETYSDVDIKKSGVYKYAESENFEILLFAVSINGDDVIVYDLACGDVLPDEILDAIVSDDVIKWAFNASFERIYFHPRSACGEMFRRIHWNNRGCKSIVWRCISRLEPTGQECHARTVNETVLENVVVQAINTLLGDTSTYQAQLQQNIAKVIRSAQQKTADGIDERLQELQKELLKKANNKEAYDEIADEIFKLREQ